MSNQPKLLVTTFCFRLFEVKVKVVSTSPSADTVYFIGSGVDVADRNNKIGVISVFTKSVTRS